jgi:hypothetical protein
MITSGGRMTRRRRIVVAALALVALSGLGIGASFAWRKHVARAFSARYTPMNEQYKQALFLTGQGKQEPARSAHQAFTAALAGLQGAGGLAGDARLGPDLERAAALAREAGPLIEQGQLPRAHEVLEGVRPILNDVLRRNGLSALKVALVDFHDQMERVVDAGKGRSAPATLAALPSAEAGLRAVEQELKDVRVEAIRAALDRVRGLAEQGAADQLPDAAGALKSAFVKLYLAEG